MDDPQAWVRGLVRSYEVRRRRRGLTGALHDLVAPEWTTVHAVQDVSLELFAGEVVGLVGPNGAGKSTTVKCLTGLLQPTAGEVRVAGFDPWAQRRQAVTRLGVVFGQRSQLWWDLAVQEAFDLCAAIFEVPADVYAARLAELSSVLDLAPLLRTTVRELSLGQRVRCDLAASWLHAPPVMVLDEPTVGLDVAVKRRIRGFVRARADQGTAVLLTTHDLGDVDALCDRVVLIDGGCTVFEGDVPALRRRFDAGPRIVVRPERPMSDDDLEALGARLGHVVRRGAGGSVTVALADASGVPGLLQRLLAEVPSAEVRIDTPTLEDVLADWYEAAR